MRVTIHNETVKHSTFSRIDKYCNKDHGIPEQLMAKIVMQPVMTQH